MGKTNETISSLRCANLKFPRLQPKSWNMTPTATTGTLQRSTLISPKPATWMNPSKVIHVAYLGSIPRICTVSYICIKFDSPSHLNDPWYTLAWSISFLSAAICISKDCFNLSVETKQIQREHRSNGNVFGQRKRFLWRGGRFWKNADFVQVVKNTGFFLLVLGFFFLDW